MQFALFGSAQVGGERPGAALGEGFHEFVELNVEAEALGYCATFLVEHHFTGWNQVSATLQLLDLARRAHDDASPRHRCAAALAQPGSACRAGLDARPHVRWTARFRDRKRLPPYRIRRILYPARGGAGAL